MFLHKLEDYKSQYAFKEIELNGSKINLELHSHLSCFLFRESEDLQRFYQRNREKLPIIIVVEYHGTEKEIVVELSWEAITFSKIDDDKFGNLFQLNLNNIEIGKF
jgi:hypothetical protein